MTAPVSALAGYFGPERCASDPKPAGGPVPDRTVDDGSHTPRRHGIRDYRSQWGGRCDGDYVYAVAP